MTWAPPPPHLRLGLIPLLVLAVGATKARAQETGTPRERVQRTIDHVEPLVGAPGDEITVSSGDMPSMTALRVGIGAANVGFEQLTDFVTSMDGDFSVTVTVPDWAEPDRVHRFILFDLYFRPIALSGPFHVTDADGHVRRQGRVTEASGRCLRFVDVDEVEYALEGNDASLPSAGTEATLAGSVHAGSSCGAPFTLTVGS